MARFFGFRNVTYEGFAAYYNELMGVPWNGVPPKDPSKELIDCHVLTAQKARLIMAVETMLGAMGVSSKVLEASREWERVESRLSTRIAFDETDADPDRRACASRVRAAALRGSGTAQNALDADGKVDFGRTQVLMASKKTACRRH